MTDSSNLEKVRRYLKALEERKFSEVTELFAPDVVMEQLPNRIYPQGIRVGMSEMIAALERDRSCCPSKVIRFKKKL